MLEETLKEIREIPEKAFVCFEKNKNIKLPEKVFYLGMGASFTPTLALYYAGADIYPHLASEYYQYLNGEKRRKLGVLISQSGRSREVVDCRSCFKRYIAITNDPSSPLAKGENVKDVILLHVGKETSISSKTYINTLVVLYQGLGFEIEKTLDLLGKQFKNYELWGKKHAEIIYNHIKSHPWRGFYIIGSGPNLATAKQGALAMSEVTKLGLVGMTLAEYDHGPKEAVQNSIVIFIDVKGKNKERMRKIIDKLYAIPGCLPIALTVDDVDEILSPLITIIPINFLTYYLAKKLGITSVYQVGGKVVR